MPYYRSAYQFLLHPLADFCVFGSSCYIRIIYPIYPRCISRNTTFWIDQRCKRVDDY